MVHVKSNYPKAAGENEACGQNYVDKITILLHNRSLQWMVAPCPDQRKPGWRHTWKKERFLCVWGEGGVWVLFFV